MHYGKLLHKYERKKFLSKSLFLVYCPMSIQMFFSSKSFAANVTFVRFVSMDLLKVPFFDIIPDKRFSHTNAAILI